MTASTNLAPALARDGGAPAPAAAVRAAVEVVDRIEDAAEPWAELEAHGVLSPYQRYAFARAYAAHALAPSARAAVVLSRDERGRPALLLPLCVERRGLARVAAPLGAKHANFHLPLFSPREGALPGPEAVRALLREAGARLGVDVLDLRAMPRAWRGRPNPLALPEARPSASDAVRLCLAGGLVDGAPRALSKDSRKKLRKKARALSELGPVAFERVEDEAGRRETLAAFFAMKAQRMAALGLPDPFAEPGVRAFLEAACAAPAGERPAVALWRLAAGGRTAAVFGAAVDGRRACGMVTAFDPAPEIARTSPGELVLLRVVADLAEAGYESFDLGVGEAPYKASFCDTREPLVDLCLPITAAGRAHAWRTDALRAAKRAIKARPALMGAIGRARRALAPLTRRLR